MDVVQALYDRAHVAEGECRVDDADVMLQAARWYVLCEEAARKALNFIENTEGEMGAALGCGDALRAALRVEKRICATP